MVTLAVYTYFAAALMGAQWVVPADPADYVTTYKLPSFANNNSNNGSSNSSNATNEEDFSSGYFALDMYVPVFLIMQFIFYVGWLKV